MINYTKRFDKALNVATRSHCKTGEVRKYSDTPYIVHPVGAAIIAGSITDDEDILIACLLHDILENVETRDPEIYNEKMMRNDFGERVTQMVKDVSKDMSLENWHEQAGKYLYHLENYALDDSLIVCAADKTHNLMSIVESYQREGVGLWQKFTTKNKDDQIWWYESAVNILKNRNSNETLISGIEELVAKIK